MGIALTVQTALLKVGGVVAEAEELTLFTGAAVEKQQTDFSLIIY